MDRITGKNILKTTIKNPKNIELFEKYIFESSQTSENYIWYCYQVSGLLLQKEAKDVLTDIKEKRFGWNSDIYSDVANTIKEYDEYLIKPFEVAEGVSECKKCGSKKTWSVQKQTRSSDEPMTTFTRCVSCGHQWTYSG